jgi:hypothetical protein
MSAPDMCAAAAQLLGLAPERLRVAILAMDAPRKQELMKIRDAAKLLAVSPKTIGHWMATGKLEKVVLCPPHARRDGAMVGGRIAVRASDIAAIAERGVAALVPPERRAGA